MVEEQKHSQEDTTQITESEQIPKRPTFKAFIKKKELSSLDPRQIAALDKIGKGWANLSLDDVIIL